MKSNKKIIALIISVLMILAIPMSAFAAPASGTPIGTQREQDDFVMKAAYLSLDYSIEEPKWNYDENTYRYTDDEGNVWRWYDDRNWIISKENEQWLYKEIEDGTLYVTSNPSVEIDTNLVIPSSLDGKTVTRVMRAGRGTASPEYSPTLSITIPDTVVAIDYFCFRNVAKLRRVIIPTSVKSIEVEAFDLTDNIELYYCGTEEQWNEIVVWSHTSLHDSANNWAVTGFDWLGMPYESGLIPESAVKAVHFNAVPDELEPLTPKEEEKELNLFEKLVATGKTIVAKITEFFVVIAGKIKKIFG